jgi:hypothetical protein
VRFLNPYAKRAGNWLKGQLHLHTTRSDGHQSPELVVRDYERLGFDFIAFTDHNVIPAADDLNTSTRLILIPGCEYRGKGNMPEIGVIGLREKLPREIRLPGYVKLAAKKGKFLIFNHPNWHIDHWPVEWMFRLADRVHAVEIYNSCIEHLPGPAESTDKWDRLLSAGCRLWGVSAEDAHAPEHRNKAWIMLRAAPNEKAIIGALRSGNFYATTGIIVDDIQLRAATLRIIAGNAQEIRLYAHRGQMCARFVGNAITYRIHPDDVYVRAELYGFDNGLIRAWTNPVFVQSAQSRQKAAEFRNWYSGQMRQEPPLTLLR